MGKMKRAIGRSSVALISVFLLLGIFVLTACGKTEKQLSAIRIVKQPTTTVYVTGSDFKSDGMEVVAVYSDGKEKTVTGWICDVKKLTVDSGAFESSKTVTVSYTEQEITKSATLKVNVTNKITNAVIKTAPKTEYNAGQSFDCSGMVVTATLQNGATTDIEITPNNAKITPSGPLDRNTDKVTVSIGGYTIEVDVEISSAAYIEAESGLLNGEVPNPASTSDQGNFGLDATLEDAKAGAKLLKESEVKSKYVKQVKDAFIATLEDRTEQGIAAALKEYENSDTYKNLISSYLESDAYKNTIESYLASEDYLNDAENYHAHGDVYLGGLEQGDTVSFLFESSKVATGKIAFRLASSYLLRDNGEWTPIEIGDVQFNRLCEVYVNGIKCDIPDEAVLHGGVSPDGTPNPILWVNWKEVPLENISFEEGRNVIELKILHHGIVSPAQPAYNFAANIDSLLIIPDDGEDCVISPFDANRKMTQTVTSIAMKKNQNRVELTISGEYSEVIGYVPDLFDVTVGGIEATLVTYGEGKFTLKADVTELQVNNQHNIVVGGSNLRYSEDMTLPKSVAIGLIRYSVFADASNRVVLGIDSNSLVLVDSAVIETPVITLEERDGKACFVIGGGVYTATVNGYDMNDADEAELVKEILSASIKSLYLFEVQNNPADGKLEGYDVFLSNRHIVNILDDERFEVVLDVTSLKANGVYATHFNHAKADGSFPTGNGENDLKPSIDWFETETLTLASGLSYQIVYREGFAWDCVAVTVDDTFEKRYTLGNTVRLEADEETGKMYLVLDGVYENYTPEEISALTFYFDVQNPDLDWERIALTDHLSVVVTGDGTFSIKTEITQLANGQYLAHCGDGNTDIGNEDGIAEIELGGKLYSYEFRDFNGWTRYVLTIKDAPEVEPEQPEVEPGQPEPEIPEETA